MENKNITTANETSKPKKAKKEKIAKIKNRLLLKKGGFSLLVTVLFLAGVIVFNILIGVLSDRFVLEYDLSSEKQSTISETNIDYIKSIKTPINLIICSSEDDYVSAAYSRASNLYISEDYSQYYQQTLRLIKKYPQYNKNINLKFINIYDIDEATQISTKYSTDNLFYGDIIVSTIVDEDSTEKERYKTVGFEEIYNIVAADDYGYSYSITGNNAESAISSAIDYVCGEDKKAALLTGHSGQGVSELFTAYETLLTSNNFEVENIDALTVTEIPSDIDVAVIIQPTIDFQESELTVLSDFLKNDGNMKKSLVYIGGTAAVNTPNLYEFLSDWGIVIGEGKLFEISGQQSYPGLPTALLHLESSTEYYLLTDNVPITLTTPIDSSVTTEGSLALASPETVVIAPADSDANWSDYNKTDAKSYSLIAHAEMSGYAPETNEEVSSNVFAFSSADFVKPLIDNIANTNAVKKANDIFNTSGMDFDQKTISSSTSFVPVEKDASRIQRIFVIYIPIIMLAVAVVVYIRRKNAQ